jgi:phospholipid:diacylglycerol acyltransferase
VSSGGSFMGNLKPLSIMLSAEMRDTAEMGWLEQMAKSLAFEQNDLLELFHTFGSLHSMLPKGGDLVWGSKHKAFDDQPGSFVMTF